MDQPSLIDRPEEIRLRRALEQALKRAGGDVPPMWLERFLKPLQAVDIKDGRVTLAAPGKFVLEWVQQKYLGQLERLLGDELGEEVVVELVAMARTKEPAGISIPSTGLAAARPAPVASPSRFIPNPKYTFDTFVTGQSNRLAVAGAKAVAAEPGTVYNPLFIYGPSGLGKTHLLHSIAREMLNVDPNLHVAYVSAQQFAEDFISALQNGRVEQFRRSQRGVAIWLVDDIQFIAHKDKTQEEIFHTFNYLHSLGKQIVLIADRPPRDLMVMDERLRSRFESGLVADIHPPDTETRCAILKSKANLECVNLPQDVAEFLAENVPGNIRVLEGALTRLVAHAGVLEIPVTVDLATSMVEQHYKQVGIAKPSFNQIVGAVSKQFRIAPDEIKGVRRNAPIVQARHVAIYVTRELTGDSWKHIGALFGDRDHTSMMHGYQRISELIANNKELRAQVRQVMRGLAPE